MRKSLTGLLLLELQGYDKLRICKKILIVINLHYIISCSTNDNSFETSEEEATETDGTSGILIKSMKKFNNDGDLIIAEVYEYYSNGNIKAVSIENHSSNLISRTFNYDDQNKLISYTELLSNGFELFYELSYYFLNFYFLIIFSIPKFPFAFSAFTKYIPLERLEISISFSKIFVKTNCPKLL